jgi:hypothetical protein
MRVKVSQIQRSLLLSQLSLFGFLIICSILKPHVVAINGGISNFGKYKMTVVLYVLGFLLDIAFLWRASSQISKLKDSHCQLSWLLQILVGIIFLVLISTFPRYLKTIYSTVHDDLGIALYGYEFLLSIWFISKIRTRLSISLFIAEFLGSIIGLLSILKVIHFLYIGQFIGTAGFGALMVVVIPAILELLPDKTQDPLINPKTPQPI